MSLYVHRWHSVDYTDALRWRRGGFSRDNLWRLTRPWYMHQLALLPTFITWNFGELLRRLRR